MSKAVRLTTAQFRALTGQDADETPANATRRSRKPLQTSGPPPTTALVGVRIEPPRVADGEWTVFVRYTNGHVRMGVPTEAEARRIKEKIEKQWQE